MEALRGVLLGGAVATVLATGAAPAWAASITVTTTADAVSLDGACSLREAVANANNNGGIVAPGECAGGSGPDVVSLPAGTYRLTRAGFDDVNATGDLDVREALEIDGAGARDTTIDGAGNDRAIEVIGASVALSVSGVTIT